MGAYAQLQASALHLVVEALTPDGQSRFRRQGRLDDADRAGAEALGRALGEQIAAEGGERLLLEA
jgi:hydroxymethylbilane synthase